MQELNLPEAALRLQRDAEGVVRVYDPLRRKWLVLTPEENVRQHFTAYLADCLGYPRGMMANEVTISLNGTSKRCDTVVYSPELKPVAIIEYKAPEVAVTQKTFDQIARYNLVLGVEYLIVSNGLRHYCCRVGADGYRFLREIPAWNVLAATVDQKK